MDIHKSQIQLSVMIIIFPFVSGKAVVTTIPTSKGKHDFSDCLHIYPQMFTANLCIKFQLSAKSNNRKKVILQ